MSLLVDNLTAFVIYRLFGICLKQRNSELEIILHPIQGAEAETVVDREMVVNREKHTVTNTWQVSQILSEFNKKQAYTYTHTHRDTCTYT